MNPRTKMFSAPAFSLPRNLLKVLQLILSWPNRYRLSLRFSLKKDGLMNNYCLRKLEIFGIDEVFFYEIFYNFLEVSST